LKAESFSYSKDVVKFVAANNIAREDIFTITDILGDFRFTIMLILKKKKLQKVFLAGENS